MSDPSEQFRDCESDLLDPETNRGVIYMFPPDMSREARDAYKKIARVRARMEKPLHRSQNVVKDDLSATQPGGAPESSTAESRQAAPSSAAEEETKLTKKSRSKPRSKSIKKRRSRAKPRRRAISAALPDDDLAHEARCSICRHDLRADIEDEFTHWHSPENIAYDYEVSMRSVYRHARHKGLFAIRDGNLRYALGHMIDRVERIPLMTPESIIRAVHAFARMNSQGQSVEPPKHVIVSAGPAVAAQTTGTANTPISVPGQPHLALLPPSEPGVPIPQPLAESPSQIPLQLPAAPQLQP